VHLHGDDRQAVIHPGGRASTETVPERGDHGRCATRPVNARKMASLMPRVAEAVPFLGYIVVAATKPR
jgi:hypothetical protein